MRTKLREGLTAALKDRDRVAASAIRSALAAIDNAEAVPADPAPVSTAGNEHVAGAAIGLGAAEAERRHLTEGDIRSIVAAEVRDRTDTAAEYERHGRDDAAERLRTEAAVLSRYLA